MYEEGFGLYIHIPFCVKKCEYCDFLSWNAGEKNGSSRVAALLQRLKVM